MYNVLILIYSNHKALYITDVSKTASNYDNHSFCTWLNPSKTML